MKTIGELIALSSQFLQEKKVDRPKRTAEELIGHALSLKRMDLYLQFERPVQEDEIAQIRTWIKRAALQEPIAYILGEVDFFGAKIKVDSRALIPRVETEFLAERVCQEKGKVVWDLCTGTGCIGISIQKKCPHFEVTLSDISQEALDLAKENASLNQVDVFFEKGDLLEPFQGKKADLIVCNPPYVSEKEYHALDLSVKNYEPKLALVGGEDGLLFYKRLSFQLKDFLNEGGKCFLEIGAMQKEAIEKIFPSVECFYDLAGLPRFAVISLEKLNYL